MIISKLRNGKSFEEMAVIYVKYSKDVYVYKWMNEWMTNIGEKESVDILECYA